jgi:hypothetical protein
MKARVLVFILGFLLIGVNLYAADGDLIVNNKIAIGMTSPAYKLDVSGDVRFTGILQGGSVPWARLTTFPSACTTGQYVTGIGSTLTCSTPAGGGGGLSGSGTASYVSKWTAGTTLGNSQIYDNGTNVGIGTTSPVEKLQINSGNIKFGTADKGIVFYGGGEKIIGTSGYGIDFQTSNGTSRMTILNNGNVGIGIINPPNSKLEFGYPGSDFTAIVVDGRTSSGSAWAHSIYTYGDAGVYDQRNANSWTVVNRIMTNGDTFFNGGRVGIGTATPTYLLQLSQNSAAKPGSSYWTVSSDARLKTNIQPYKKGLKEILKINPVNYQYNGEGGIGHKKVCTVDPAEKNECSGTGGLGHEGCTAKCIEEDVTDVELLSKTYVGVIAQDIQSILPDTVTSHKGKLNKDDKDETDLLDFDGHELTYLLINALKELSAEIDSLNKKIADLKAKVK